MILEGNKIVSVSIPGPLLAGKSCAAGLAGRASARLA